MRRISWWRRIGWGLILGVAMAVDASAFEATNLRCEFLADPLGIDVEKPRLSWTLQESSTKPATRGQHQTAYRILVASSEALLQQYRGDLWDSGRVESDATAHIEYAGVPLTSRRSCFWMVQSYDRGGKASAWSAPARWEMGLLNPADWKAQWIDAAGYPAVTEAQTVEAVRLRILKATYGAEGSFKDVTAVVAGQVAQGGLALRADNALFGDPAYMKKKTFTMEYELNGKAGRITVPEDEMVTVPATFRPTALVAGRVSYLRKSLELANKKIARARLYVTALGLYEMHLNGQRVGDIHFAPEWTDYRKRVHYNVFDVAPMLRAGVNVLAGQVGPGWYSGHVGMGAFQFYGKVPALRAQLEVTYSDGATETVVTDGSWKAAAGPILSSDFMKGENYDARREIAGWNAPGLDDRAWSAVTVREEKDRVLQGVSMNPVRIVKELPAQNVSEPAPGAWTFDLGQNMVGVVRLQVAAPAGTKLTLRYGEMLNPDGTLYTKNLRGATSIDTYICRGSGVETYVPRFTFHGFRYVEVTGLPAKPAPGLITGLVIASDLLRTSEFHCSDERVNQLYSNIVWGQRGNFLSIPTDCPQRDERCGWAGDAQVFARTATYNADVAAFYRKWLTDVRDAQTAEGAVADVSPRVGFNVGAPGWADAIAICSWTMYHVYGDRRVLEENYEAMVKWVEWCRKNSTELIRNKHRGNDYGDWLSINANTPKELIGTAYFAYSTRLLAQAAEALGKREDAAKYAQLFQDIRAAFNKKYVSADGRIEGNTQSAYLMALKFDLLSDDLRAKAAQYLVEDIRAKQMHLSTGFIGVSYLLPTLTAVGANEAAHALFLQDSFPSWLFSVKHGATTIWERWDGWTPERGFQDPGMNSFNHFSLGSCGEWMFASLAGIDTEGPGFRKLILRPTLGDRLTEVNATYRSINGPIAMAWKKEADSVHLDVTVPVNTTATVYVPVPNGPGGLSKDTVTITESDSPAEEAQGVQFLRMENDAVVYAVGSGTYRFVSKRK